MELIEPVGEDGLGFAEGVDQFAIQALFPKAGIETLHVAILPWTVGIGVGFLFFFPSATLGWR